MKPNYILGLPPATGKDEVVSLDIETFEQNGEQMHIANGSLAAMVVSTRTGNYLVQDEVDVRRAVRKISDSTIAMHHGLYDMRYLRKFGVDPAPLRVWDTEVADHVRHSGLYQQFGLADVARRELGVYLNKNPRESFGGARHELSPADLHYTASDGEVTRQIALRQMEAMDEAEHKVYWEIEHPSYKAILNMRGVRVDQAGWLTLAQEMEAKGKRLQEQIGVNVNSHKKLQEHIQKTLKLNLPDTRAETLEEYANFELISAILECRGALKNASTYGLKWLEQHVQPDGLVYADVQQCGTETDRWAKRNPNLQQIPVRKEPRYRFLFLPTEAGELILAEDADQQEVRVRYYFTRAARLGWAFANKIKTHLVVARDVFKDPSIQKGSLEYRKGKDINLGLSFGLSAHGLARRYHMTTTEAVDLVDRYFQQYPEDLRWMQMTRASGQALGYVRGSLGMKGHLNLYTGQWDRNAINLPIQQTAAHITKKAIHRLEVLTAEAGLPFGLIMGIHDELVASPAKRTIKRYGKLMTQAWHEAADYVIPGVPFETETYIGETWGKEE
jgi:DNA polymerase-1